VTKGEARRIVRTPLRAASLLAIGIVALTACARSGSMPRPTPRRVAPPLPPAGATTLERQVFDLVNRHRVARGLRPLVLDARISREARRHSAAMASGSIPPGHRGFDDRFATLRRTTGCRRLAENVAMNQGLPEPASEAVEDWLASRPHRTNIEGRYDATGIGVATNSSGQSYFTQLFAAR
jgi:uncharacterized protein YkwD